MYCISGCDTVSSLIGHGKKTAFKAFRKHSTALQWLKDLGQELTLSESQIGSGIQFVRILYGDENTKSLDNLKCIKAKSKVGPRKLPPTDGIIKCNLLRAVLQLYI